MAKGEKAFSIEIPMKLNEAFKHYQEGEGLTLPKKLLGAVALYQVCTLDEFRVIEALRAMRSWMRDGGDEIPIADEAQLGEPPGAKLNPGSARPRQKTKKPLNH